MNSHRIRLIIYFAIPILAILACNAPVDELIPQRGGAPQRPTIGPPPTLTPITLGESEFVIVTATPAPTTVETPTPKPSPKETIEPSKTATIIPTVTLNPAFGEQIASTKESTSIFEPQILYTLDWNEDGADDENPFRGVITITMKKEQEGVDYSVNGITLANNSLILNAGNCQIIELEITAQAEDIGSIIERKLIEAPCFEDLPKPTSPADVRGIIEQR